MLMNFLVSSRPGVQSAIVADYEYGRSAKEQLVKCRTSWITRFGNYSSIGNIIVTVLVLELEIYLNM